MRIPCCEQACPGPRFRGVPVELHHQLTPVRVPKLNRHIPRRYAPLEKQCCCGMAERVEVPARTAGQQPEPRPVPMMRRLGPHAISRAREQQPGGMRGHVQQRVLRWRRNRHQARFAGLRGTNLPSARPRPLNCAELPLNIVPAQSK